MDEPLTEDLLDERLDTPSAEKRVGGDASARALSEYLSELLRTHVRKPEDVIREAGIDAAYGRQLFAGERLDLSRNTVLTLAFAMGCSLRETDRLLQAAGMSRLYVKERRDAVIAFCLDQHASLAEANESLHAMGEATIG